MNLSPNFTLEEATVSDTAARLGIDNQPDAVSLANMIDTASKLELLRAYLGKPIHTTSWYRSPVLNIVIPGSSRTSAHMTGYAVDCHVSGLSALELCKEAARFFDSNNIPYDQIIHEYGKWMHISFTPTYRRQTLTIFKNNSGKKYVAGLLTEKEYNLI